MSQNRSCLNSIMFDDDNRQVKLSGDYHGFPLTFQVCGFTLGKVLDLIPVITIITASGLLLYSCTRIISIGPSYRDVESIIATFVWPAVFVRVPRRVVLAST